MPVETNLVEQAISDELSRIGVTPEHVVFEQIDVRASIVTIVSSAFEGQTYLDREHRVRPAVLRALASSGLAHLSVVVDPLEPELGSPMEVGPTGGEEDGEGEDPEARVSRSRWRAHVQAVLTALTDSKYELEPLSEAGLFIASRSGLSEERIIVAFAPSPKASIVDVGVRRTIEDVRRSQTITSSYYITAEDLDRPFSNQSQARWLQVVRYVDFLHILNSSQRIAESLLRECEAVLNRVEPILRGPVIEPELVVGSTENQRPAFEFLEEWLHSPTTSFLLLMAPAGHGKTTIATELTRRLAKAHIEDPTRPVPLLVGFEAVRRTVDFEALLHKRISQLKGGAFGAFRELLKLNEAVLVVDGFDELAEDAGVGVAEAQVRSMRPFVMGRAHVILAGRSAFAEQFTAGRGATERISELLGEISIESAEIQAFSEDTIAEYVETRDELPSIARSAALTFATTTADHRELCGNPLLLSLVCGLASDDRLPKKEVIATIDPLLEAVCAREEKRQHLGIGVEPQLVFLQEVALEAFRGIASTGNSAVLNDSVRLAAQIAVSGHPELGPEVVGRLTDHALFTAGSSGKTTFVHPLIRDVLIGRAIIAHPTDEHLGVGRLPEGSARYIGRRVAHSEALRSSFFRGTWLSDPGKGRTVVRQNLFRTAVISAKLRSNGDPRAWAKDEWMRGKSVRGLDLSQMFVTDVLFDELDLHQCSFEGSLLLNAEFRGGSLEACILEGAAFYDCIVSPETGFRQNSVAETVFGVPTEQRLALCQSDSDILEWVKANSPDRSPSKAGPTSDVVGAVRELVRQVLRLLVSEADGAPRFNAIPVHEFLSRAATISGDDHVAVRRVIAPRLMSKVCEQWLAGSSVKMVGVAKAWHSPVAEFLGGGSPTAKLEEVLAGIATRAARFLA